jgi:exopolysaccharide biosynthesis polyprenyl glycosylphosphotransferase
MEYHGFYELLLGKIDTSHLRPSWFIFSDGFKISQFKKVIKRIISIILSVLGIIITSPIMLITALLIKLDSKGPVFFKQARVGKNGRIFTLIKFRTMKQDAEKHSGPVWAQDDDPRITGLGRILRKFRIDELPQMFNVLKGEMNFVGPRPERPFFVEKLKKQINYYGQRLTVEPGITGWAAIKCGYGSSVEDAIEKLEYDLFYIKNFSIFFDFFVILLTLKVVIFGKGAK